MLTTEQRHGIIERRRIIAADEKNPDVEYGGSRPPAPTEIGTDRGLAALLQRR